MKAITPIIAIIVLLLITISLAAAGWTFLSGYTGSLLSKQIDISGSVCVGGDRVKIFVKNIGTASISTDEISVIDKDTGNPITSGARWGMSEPEKDPSLVLYYSFDEPGDPQDESLYGNDGTVYGDPVWTPDGKIGGAYHLDGNDDYIIIPYDTSLTPNEFTVSLWAKSDVDETSAFFRSAGGNGYGYGFALLQSSGGAAVLRWGDGTNPDGSISISGNPTSWRHIAGTYDGSTMMLIVNGTYEGEDTTVNFNYLNTQDAWIGSSSGVEEFDGIIDEVRIYNRTLSSGEIAALATTSVTINPEEVVTMTHTCASLDCHYVISLGGYTREVTVRC